MAKKQTKQSRRWEIIGTASIYAGIVVLLLSWLVRDATYSLLEEMESAARPAGQLHLGLAEYFGSLMLTGLWVLFGLFLIGYGIYCYKKMKKS